VAFSGDTEQKIDVQHKIEQRASLFYEWLQNEAFVYICGAAKMGRDVRRAVSAVIQQTGQMPYDEAVAFVEKTEEQGRWHENLY
jgi:sulfite reductase (NADPH) flavoprotein alpha-component